MGISIGMGAFFLVFQGYEWVQLIKFGLTLTSGAYGGLFYLIIGTHGLHAVAALMGLLYVYYRIFYKEKLFLSRPFVVTEIFWYFVVGIWPLLFVVVYLL